MDKEGLKLELPALKTKIGYFKEGVKNFIATVNANSSNFSPKEISDLALISQNLSNICEICHNALSLLPSVETLNGDSHLAIELWNLTRAFEYTRRKYEILVLTQKRREMHDA